MKFGTDGIRGIAGEQLNAELAFKVGQAAATVLRQNLSQVIKDENKFHPINDVDFI